jgi:hypothetical protein
MKQAALVLCLPLALAACGVDTPAPDIFCPKVNVLEETSSLTQFLPGRQDAGAEVTSAHMTGVAGSCALKGGSMLNVTFQAGFSASNGPANHGRTLELPYFVAVTAGDEIIAKTLDTMAVPFSGNVSAAAVTSKTLTVEVPNTDTRGQAEILVGFQLTPAQLAYAEAHPAP